MTNYRIIGVGAAGNKGAIELIKGGVIGESEVLLLNTTLRDVDANFRKISHQIGSTMNGSGKERKLAYQITQTELRSNRMGYIDEFLKDADNIYTCIIITAIGGGSGSGASIALADYIANMGINVHLCGYIGFGSDSRELQNTLGFAKSIQDDFGVEFICNAKFLEEAGNNVQKAEVLANKEFVNRMKIFTGMMLRDSSQNIDDTELYKINTTVGFTAIEYASLPKIKNQAQFDKIINDMVDQSKSPDYDPKAVRLGIMMNVNDDSFGNIDTRFESIKDRFSKNPDELFVHIQNEPDMDEFIAVIACGNEIPIEEIKTIGEELSKRQATKRETVDRSKFFKEIGDIDIDDSLDDMDLNFKRKRTSKVMDQKLNGF